MFCIVTKIIIMLVDAVILSDEVLARCLSVCSKVQMISIWSS